MYAFRISVSAQPVLISTNAATNSSIWWLIIATRVRYNAQLFLLSSVNTKYTRCFWIQKQVTLSLNCVSWNSYQGEINSQSQTGRNVGSVFSFSLFKTGTTTCYSLIAMGNVKIYFTQHFFLTVLILALGKSYFSCKIDFWLLFCY